MPAEQAYYLHNSTESTKSQAKADEPFVLCFLKTHFTGIIR